MNRVAIEKARTGDLTARLGSLRLHSRFDPRREAVRFVDDGAIPHGRTYIVIGPGLGYCVSALRARFPGSRIVCVAVSNDLAARSVAAGDASWTPFSRTPLPHFLDRHVSDLDAASVSVVEWGPVVEAFPQEARIAREAVRSHLRRAQSSLLTQGGTGRRWLRNRIHNFLHVRPCVPRPGDRAVAAVVVVGSGPSLERSLDRLRPLRDRLDVWATGSALEACTRRGIAPDLVVVTDAAVYAGEHVRSALVGDLARIPIAAPLSATRSLAQADRVVVVSEGDDIDERLVGEAQRGRSSSAPVIPPHGTVTATAASLARSLTTAPIVLAGVDFAWYRGRSHARPHLSEVYLGSRSSRLSSSSTRIAGVHLSQNRVSGYWSTERSLSTYADWLTASAHERFGPVYAIEPSPMLNGIPRIAPTDLRSWPTEHRSTATAGAEWPARNERARIVRRYLSDSEELVRAVSEPAFPARSRSETAAVNLAIQLALPELLRWYRKDEGGTSWDDVRKAVEGEIASARRIVP